MALWDAKEKGWGEREKGLPSEVVSRSWGIGKGCCAGKRGMGRDVKGEERERDQVIHGGKGEAY